MQTDLSHAEQLRLVIDARELFTGAGPPRFLRRRNGTYSGIMPRKFVLGILLLDPQGKDTLLKGVVSTFQLSTQVPALYQEFLCKSVVCVRKSTPFVITICQSYKLVITTDEFEYRLTSNKWHCCYSEVHSRFGVPLVNGHVFTRFQWLRHLSPSVDPAVFEENMKNRTVPPWSLAHDVEQAQKELHFLATVACVTLTANILSKAHAAQRRATAQCPSKHHASVQQH